MSTHHDHARTRPSAHDDARHHLDAHRDDLYPACEDDCLGGDIACPHPERCVTTLGTTSGIMLWWLCIGAVALALCIFAAIGWLPDGVTP